MTTAAVTYCDRLAIESGGRDNRVEAVCVAPAVTKTSMLRQEQNGFEHQQKAQIFSGAFANE